ncbi:MAG: CPBP family intramembrane metalloprotease [Clostridia bacterium]|nr:CPBP family intramembrane metalloprotease [Clostridia bacterium]
MKNYFKNPANTAPILVLSVFLLLFTSRFIDTALLTRDNEYVAVIVLQLVIFLMPAAFYIKALGLDFGRFRLSLFGPGHLLLLISALISLTTGTILIDHYVIGGDSLSASYDLWGVFISKNEGGVGNTLYLILAYAALPAFCEEFVFRGLLISEYEKRSTTASVLLSSLFFALLHFDIARFPTYFFAGLILALTLYASRSLLAVMLIHFCNNMVGIFGRPYMQTLEELGGDEFFMTLLIAVFLLFTGIFAADAARLYKNYARLDLSSEYRRIDPPYPPATADSSPLEEMAAKHPRIAATLGAFFSFPSLVCYIAYTAAVFIDF